MKSIINVTVLPALYRNFEKFDDIQDYLTRFLGPKIIPIYYVLFSLSCLVSKLVAVQHHRILCTAHRGTTADSFTFTDIYGKEFEYDKSQKKNLTSQKNLLN